MPNLIPPGALISRGTKPTKTPCKTCAAVRAILRAAAEHARKAIAPK